MDAAQYDQVNVEGRLRWGPMILALTALLLTLVVFRDGLARMVEQWNALEEYNHGYLIGPVAFYLLWLRAKQIGSTMFEGSWVGLILVLLALGGFLLGELSTIYVIISYSFLLSLCGLVLAGMGWRGLKIVWVPLVYLIFMIPLPVFFLSGLSAKLQLISSELGVAVIRWFGISVFLEGNVIDLGVYQLQVAEACSGLNYLFPLMSFGFLCAALFKAPWWQRSIIFLSSIPLTILMNSFRIGVIGVLVENFGIEQAEGFLHYFEGWVVFMVCVALMFLLMWAFARWSGQQRLMAAFGLDVPPVADLKYLVPRSITPQFIGVVVVLAAGVVLALSLQRRVDLVPERTPLAEFPLVIDGWHGRDGYVEKIFLDRLKVDDHLMINYKKDDGGFPVELWIAYYDTQKKGQSAHSPRTCLPGGGWQIESLQDYEIPDVGPDGSPLQVNRAVIVKESARQLVYYWFVERGRIVTNEYLVKWHIFWDALTKNRTDGALVRLVTFVPDKADLPEADARLQDFVRAIDAQLNYFLPQEDTPVRPLVSDAGPLDEMR